MYARPEFPAAIEIKDGKQMTQAIRTQPGTFELGLHFLATDALDIISITLN